MEGAGFAAGTRASPYEFTWRPLLAEMDAVPAELGAPFYRAAPAGSASGG